MKILIVNLGGMGDFLLSLAAVSALRDFYKDSQIILLTIPRTKPVAEAFPYFDEIIAFDFSFLGHSNSLLLCAAGVLTWP